MHCNKVLFQELLDCFANDLENNIENKHEIWRIMENFENCRKFRIE